MPDGALVAAVEAAGYGAHVHGGGHHHEEEPVGVLTRRLAVAVALTVPVALLAMVPALQFAGWEWVALALSTPVVFYCGLGFHRAALAQRPPRRGDDGHADLARHARGLVWSTVVLVAGTRRATRTSRSPRS